jgi:hypothetical protein
MSKIQNTDFLFTTKEKYMAASHACEEEIWLKGLLGEFGMMEDKVKVFFYSQSDINFTSNVAYHSRMKHIYMKYHFVRQVVDEGGVALENVHSKVNSTKRFMKSVLLEKLRQCLVSWLVEKVMN